MKNTSINISGKISEETAAMFEAVHNIAMQLKIPYLVVGATARDLVMHHGFGMPIQRATADADFGIEVLDWSSFDNFKTALLANAFATTKHIYRLQSPQNIPIDIVPFGKIADEDANIQWPPDGNFKMEVLGFQEACNHALSVQIKDSPLVIIPVASPAGLALMKTIAWKDREIEKRNKDANDLHYLLAYYGKISTIENTLFTDQTLAERYEWDMEIAGAHQLGIDAKSISADTTTLAINDVLSIKFDEFLNDIHDKSDRTKILLNAFKSGFLNQ